jgi:hypothetical protein
VVASLDLEARNVTRHPRSTRLASTVYSLKRGGDRLHLLPTALRERLRGAYVRLNSGELSERLDPAVRRHVEDVYRDSNLATARILTAHGYSNLPAWLRVSSAA